MKLELLKQPVNQSALFKGMLAGGAIALVLISMFVLSVPHPNPAWGSLWMVRPIIVVTLAGAVGGAFFGLVNHVATYSGWKKLLVVAGCAVVYVIGLWLGSVLGLNGTLWN